MIMQAHSAKNFETFMSQLQPTNVTLASISDFNKVANNVWAVQKSLNKLNALLGKQNLRVAVEMASSKNRSVSLNDITGYQCRINKYCIII